MEFKYEDRRIVVKNDVPQMEEGKKYDAGKPQYSLIPPDSLLEVVKVLTFGARKYGDDNWKIVPSAKQRYTDAAMRHIEAWRSGTKLDEESGYHHLAHAMCCLLFLLWIDLQS